MSDLGNDPLKSLLRWGIENSNPDRLKELGEAERASGNTKTDKFDKELVDHILGYNRNDSLACELLKSFLDLTFEQDLRQKNLDQVLDLLDDNPDLCFRLENGCLWPAIMMYLKGQPENQNEVQLACHFNGRFLKEILSNNPPIQKQFTAMDGIPLLIQCIKSTNNPQLKASLLSLLFVVAVGDLGYAHQALQSGLLEILSQPECDERYLTTALKIFDFLSSEFQLFSLNDFEPIYNHVMNSSMSTDIKQKFQTVYSHFTQSIQ